MKLIKLFSILLLINSVFSFLIMSFDEGMQGLVWLNDFRAIFEFIGSSLILTSITFAFTFVFNNLNLVLKVCLAYLASILTIALSILFFVTIINF